MPQMRFHKHHGYNIELTEECQIAKRKFSFANAITFGQHPLKPGDLFLFEIESQELGWSGHLRCGLTQYNPENLKCHYKVPSWPDTPPASHSRTHHVGAQSSVDSEAGLEYIPQYSMPDLTNMGKSWMHAVTKYPTRSEDYPTELDNPFEVAEQSKSSNKFIQNIGNFLIVGKSTIPKRYLVRDDFAIDMELNEKIASRRYSAVCVGSRIGITFNIQGDSAYMYFIINGEDSSGTKMERANLSAPFFPVVDVYGVTKQVRILQISYMPSLQEMCRDVIISQITSSAIGALPLPSKLKHYLKFE
ncbi:neuralized-like protein 2 [Anneissia japonica]|uniref:neuralized-like protein 2 n=1 Tax=Anneissia japonica TaxID=1529436 RepID=UPI001425711D|nr:neuralized-like protein 2 [Anneissia japonica]